MILKARQDDHAAVLGLAKDLASASDVKAAAFGLSWEKLRTADDAVVLVLELEGNVQGYLLGFSHLTFFANGPVGVVEEIIVAEALRGQGWGKALMDAFEVWASERGCSLASVVTRRAPDFYKTIGYDESAAYFRKIL